MRKLFYLTCFSAILLSACGQQTSSEEDCDCGIQSLQTDKDAVSFRKIKSDAQTLTNGEVLISYENENTKASDITYTLSYLDKEGEVTGKDSISISGLSAQSEGYLLLTPSTKDYNQIEISTSAKASEESVDLNFSPTENDNKINISLNKEENLENVTVTIVFFKDDEVVSAERHDINQNTSVTVEKPYDSSRYEISVHKLK